MVTSVQHITEKLQYQNLSDDIPFDCIQLHEKIRHHSEPGRISSKFTDNRRLQKFPPCCGSNDSFTSTDCIKPGTHCSLETPPLCIHGTSLCKQPPGDTSGFNPPAPPKKRHCRSLSIPGNSTWPSENVTRKLHKPVALRPHHNNNHKLKNRNSPLLYNKRNSSSPINSAFSSISPGGTLTTSDYFSTPPDSPVPRPASVSSGYYDSSLNSLNAPWLDHCNSSSLSHTRFNTFKSRSLSFEDRISDCPSGGSMPVMPGCVGSTPSSPRRQRILRCHSQPCVLHEHERKCGIKRRRDEDRPALNFDKMTESVRSRAIPHSYKPVRSLGGIFTDPSHILTSIASSPLDSSIPSSFSPPKTTVIEKNCLLLSDTNIKSRSEIADFKPHIMVSRSDSGCCVGVDDPPDILDNQKEGWDSHDQHESGICHGDSEMLFPLDSSLELDLDQIEND